jgi:predicted site-specific integrase-resolvase
MAQKRGEGLKELSESLGVSYDSLWRAAKSGALRVIRIGKRVVVPAAEIERISREGLESGAKRES